MKTYGEDSCMVIYGFINVAVKNIILKYALING